MHCNVKKLVAAVLVIAPFGIGGINPTQVHASTNLVQNGDFELGNTGFTSDYGYYPVGSPTSGSGHDFYQISTDARTNNNLWVALADHTSGSGNYMNVDASNASNKAFWGQSIGVVTGRTYEISGWFSSLYPVSDPTLKWTIGGADATPTFDLATPGTWEQHTFLWTATSNTLDLALTDTNTQESGNDFAVDDLSVRPVPEASTVVLFSLLAVGGMLMLRKRSAKASA